MTVPWLTILWALPILGAVVILALPATQRQLAKYAALAVSLAGLLAESLADLSEGTQVDSSSEVLAASLACSSPEAVVESSAMLGGSTAFDMVLYRFIRQKGRTRNDVDQLHVFERHRNPTTGPGDPKVARAEAHPQRHMAPLVGWAAWLRVAVPEESGGGPVQAKFRAQCCWVVTLAFHTGAVQSFDVFDTQGLTKELGRLCGEM